MVPTGMLTKFRPCLFKLASSANLRRYSYWPLVVLSCSITQHLANIFIFLSVFVRLKEESLDPRSLVCISTLLFCIGYTAWVVLNANEASGKTAVNRKSRFYLGVFGQVNTDRIVVNPCYRSQNVQIVYHDVFDINVAFACATNADSSDVFRLYLGAFCCPVSSQCTPSRLSGH